MNVAHCHMHPNRLWCRYRQQQRQGARESRRSREGLVGNLKGLNHRYVQVFFITLFPLLNIYIPLDYAFGTNNHTQTPLATMSQPRSPPAVRHQWMAQWMDARPYVLSRHGGTSRIAYSSPLQRRAKGHSTLLDTVRSWQATYLRLCYLATSATN